MYRYWGFGLNIASEIEFSELLPFTFENADVTISKGSISQPTTGTITTLAEMSFTVSDAEFFLDVFGICRYYAANGKTIIIDPYNGIDECSVRLYLLGTVIAATLFQRGCIPLHSSGIVKNGKLILFTGDSGAGKSTTIAALALKGYQVFTDDICVIHADNDERAINGTASYPMMKLWDDALEKLNHESYSNKEFKIRHDINKYGHFFHDRFDIGSYPIEKIFVIKKEIDTKTVSYTHTRGMNAFWELKKQVYRSYLIQDDILKEKSFKTIGLLANKTNVYELKRNASSTVEEFISIVEALL